MLRKAKLLLRGTVQTVLPQRVGNSEAICSDNLCLRTYFILITSDCWRSYSHARLCPRNTLNRCVSLRARASNWSFWLYAFTDFLLHSNEYFHVIWVNKRCPFLTRFDLHATMCIHRGKCNFQRYYAEKKVAVTAKNCV